MTTPKSDHNLKYQCTCTANLKAKSPDTKTYSQGIFFASGSSELSSVENLGAAQGRNLSFESLKHTLSSDSAGRGSLYTLPIEEAATVIDALEQGSREGSSLCTHHQKRFSMVLRKMCREHRRLPSSYTTTDELEWIKGLPCGGGGNADVWRGVYRGSTVAIKVLRVNSRVDLVSLERKFCCEVVLWKQFKHPNLLPLMGAKKTSQNLMMISEWMEHGTIMDFITTRPETNRLRLLADVARGLEYLHNWPSVHADLKSSNILIDSNCSARIADFGLTSLLRHPSISISVSTPAWGGTPQWMAPELFDGSSRPSKESDIYALGMVIYEVLAHKRPFSSVLHYVVPGLVLAGKRPSRPTNHDILGLSEDVWLLMEKCWDLEPTTRPHITDILALFEKASDRWVSPTSEEIADLCLGRPTSQNPPETESADTMSDNDNWRWCCGSREAGQSSQTSSR